MRFKILAVLGIASALAACSYLPQVNTELRVEVRDIKEVVECEIASAVRALGPSLFEVGAWHVKSTLDVTLVQTIGADGGVAYLLLPIGTTPTSSLSGGVKRTSTAHVEFITPIEDAIKRHKQTCEAQPDPSDPSGTGLGLAAWIQSTFLAIGKKDHAGLTYAKIFELSAGGGPRYGFNFVGPLAAEVGVAGHLIKTNQLVVSLSPHAETPPIPVVLVGDEVDKRPSKRQQNIANPIGNQMLRQQAPVRLLPGTTLPVR